MTMLQRWRERQAAKVEQHQTELIGAGVMCPDCRHTTTGAGPFNDRAATRGGICLAVRNEGHGPDDRCTCSDWFHSDAVKVS